MVKRRTYDLLYRIVRLFRIPISVVFGTHPELEQLVATGRLSPPGRAIDLGCGAGREAIFLARRGFEVTGVDFSPTAIEMAEAAAAEAGVSVSFVVDDLTRLTSVAGTFDVLVDYGTLIDLDSADRDRYIENVVPLAGPGSRFVLMCFDSRLPEDEVLDRFGDTFGVERVSHGKERGFRRTMSTYLLVRPDA